MSTGDKTQPDKVFCLARGVDCATSGRFILGEE